MSSDRFHRLVEIVATLRSEEGCPWDREQTHETLKDSLLEEAYEAVEAIDDGDAEKLKEELGDLLMVLLLHIQIATEQREFELQDMLAHITEKLIRRHPHVFGDAQVRDATEVLQNWQQIKQQEESHRDRTSLMDGIPKPLPALMAAQKIQRRAARAGFDWQHIDQVLPKLAEELDEFHDAVANRNAVDMEMEFGDLLFSMVNVARFLNVDAEGALRRSSAKFAARFRELERTLAENGTDFDAYDLEGLDQIWDEIKTREGE